MHRILAIDYGEKNIGIAVSDLLHLFSKPLTTITNLGFSYIVKKLSELIKEQNVGLVLLGLPLSVAGLDTQKTAQVRAFYEQLKQELTVSIELWDERYTTMDARDLLIKKGIKQKAGKKIIDQTAAAMILKNYLEARK